MKQSEIDERCDMIMQYAMVSDELAMCVFELNINQFGVVFGGGVPLDEWKPVAGYLGKYIDSELVVATDCTPEGLMSDRADGNTLTKFRALCRALAENENLQFETKNKTKKHR